MIKIAHIVNPVRVNETSDLHAAQPVTFESMLQAQAFAENSVPVELLSAQFPEDEDYVPPFFRRTDNLDRSVLDVGRFDRQRKLPLIGDILDRLYATSKADYFIYTNVDIGLMPYFYVAVDSVIKSGVDAMVINRRTIAKEPSNPKALPLIWAQAGKDHPGYDCFVFRREAYDEFDLGLACIGANWIGRVLLANVYAFSSRFNIFEDLHLTFHLGDDRAFKTPKYHDYESHNLGELRNILENLDDRGLVSERPLLKKFLLACRPEATDKKGRSAKSRWWRLW